MKTKEQNDNISEEDNLNNLCIMCNEREKDYSENSYSQMCSECRKHRKKMNIPLRIIFFLVVICAIFILSIIKLPPVLSDYRNFLKAEENMNDKEFSLAYKKYITLLEKYNSSLMLAYRTADAAMNAQYFYELNETYNKYLAGKDVSDEQYAKAVEYVDLLDIYIKTLDELQKIKGGIDEKIITENPEEASRIFTTKLKELLENKEMDKTLIYYYLGNISEDFEEALEYMKKATEYDSRFTYPLAYYGNALRSGGKYGEARETYQKALNLNATDALAIRGLSILYLLEGEKKLALEKVRYAYELEPEGLYIADALVITLYENSLKEEADALLKSMTDKGFVIPEDLAKYLDGTTNVKEYYVRESGEQ